MPDFIVFDISYINRDFLLRLPFLDFRTVVSKTTGHLKDKDVAIFLGLKIILYKTKAVIRGSIHKAYNMISDRNRNHNCNDFTFANFKYIVSYLKDKLGLNPSKSFLKTMEFGVNIEVNSSAAKIIEENIFSHKFTSAPEENRRYGNKGRYKMFATTQFQIKCYDKSQPCGFSNHLMRIELRTLKAQYTQRLKIFTLADLLEQKNLHLLERDLLRRINELIILDNYCKRATPEYWLSVKAKTKPRTLHRRKQNFLAEMEANNQFQVMKDILKRVSSKTAYLID